MVEFDLFAQVGNIGLTEEFGKRSRNKKNLFARFVISLLLKRIGNRPYFDVGGEGNNPSGMSETSVQDVARSVQRIYKDSREEHS